MRKILTICSVTQTRTVAAVTFITLTTFALGVTPPIRGWWGSRTTLDAMDKLTMCRVCKRTRALCFTDMSLSVQPTKLQFQITGFTFYQKNDFTSHNLFLFFFPDKALALNLTHCIPCPSLLLLFRSEVKWSEFNLRPTVSRSVYLGVGLPSGAHD
jgi:hypothetical protein